VLQLVLESYIGIGVLKGYKATGVLQGFICSIGVHE